MSLQHIINSGGTVATCRALPLLRTESAAAAAAASGDSGGGGNGDAGDGGGRL
jgi:hypothetical protein